MIYKIVWPSIGAEWDTQHTSPVAVDVDYPEPGEYESRQEPAVKEKRRGEGEERVS